MRRLALFTSFAGETMNRANWRFEYTASQLAEQSRTKQAHHAERLATWRHNKAKVIEKIKSEGMDVHESLADKAAVLSMVSNRSPGYGAQITIDGTLQRDLNECGEKIAEHDLKQKQYDAWAQVLEADISGHPLSLDHEDWMFFFGK
jgi:hypothetical protein